MLNPGRTAFAALGVALALPATAAVADPAPTGVTIQIATINGTGCPPGTVSVALSPDKGRFTVAQSGMRVEVGGASGPTASQQSCQLSLIVRVPQTHSYAIKRTSALSGSAHLEPGASSALTWRNYLQGTPDPQPIDYSLSGPFTGAWRIEPPDSAPIYAPCGATRSYNISTELRADVGTSDTSKTSYMAVDGRGDYQFLWKECL
jgi:hypothetical protein